MNWDTVKGDWKQFKGKVKEQWGKLTDDDLNRIEGKREQLAGAIEKRYGIAKDEADRQVTAFEKQCGECDEDESRMAAESQSRQPHERNMAGTKSMHNPSHNTQRQAGEGGQARHETQREESKAPGHDPKFNKQQSGGGQRMHDKDMGGEKHEESKRPASGQKQQSQPHGKK
jgi:uncharacterized protein YjbJ (UPF0337 family)